jgi:hypothetical protein
MEVALESAKSGRTRAAGAMKALFIRSVPVPMAIRALEQLRQRGCRPIVLTNVDAGGQLKARQLAEQIVPYRGTRFGLLAAGLRDIVALRRERFDLVIVPFTGSITPFWNVARLALALGGKRCVWLDCGETGASAGLDACHDVSVARWWRESHPFDLLRHALLACFRLPGLLLFYVAAMLMLSIVAAVLLPLVWLKPSRPSDRS